VQAKVEARKNLNAMGMTYHSQQHFIDAIRRKDDVAVQLFIEGGGVRPDVADSTGKTPLQIAEAEGTPEIVALLQPTAQAASPTPAAAAPHSQMQTQPEVPSILRASDAREPEVDFSRVPPELLAEIDGEVAQMNLSPEQAQLARANLARQYLKMKALADALN
jgi:ankyrin repeat protein